ncbi:uncharacterized protein LOC133814305 [Humulus lupulus]|uniref:uncharacterized protein LOC133814305 n=1 Tax=Humulus lupulus TaxID=3486 RepID=UPI002B40B7AA|nr:uncharacterized protein LOC133814305 [Humulus lupulus]
MARGEGVQTRSSSETSNQFSALDPGGRSFSDDARNPYFLSNSDYPGASLVPKILTGCENYSSWRRAMTVALIARNKLRFVNGKLLAPDEDDDDFELWNRCKSTVISWILHAVSNEIAESIMYMESATTIWTNLEERFNQKNDPRVFEAIKTKQSLAQGSSSVTNYFTRLKSLWDLIQEYRPQPACTCGAMKIIQEYHDED